VIICNIELKYKFPKAGNNRTFEWQTWFSQLHSMGRPSS
jgi:hypothetical protein